MKHASTLLLGVIAAISFSCSKGSGDSEHILYYDSPADVWQEMLPVGNGRMGMMTDGDPTEEHIILNEISLWSGCEMDYANPDAAESLPVIRQALLEGHNAEAQKIMYERFVPKKDTDGGTYGTYQVLGQLIMRHGYDEAGAEGQAGTKNPDTAEGQDGAEGQAGAEGQWSMEGYRRWLDLREATSYTEYSIGGVKYQKKYYVSRTDDVMVVEVSASEPGSINLEVELDRAGRAAESLTEDGLLKFSGTLDSGTEAPGMRYCAYAQVTTEGKESKLEYTQDSDLCIKVCDADRIWITISAATNYFTKDYENEALSRLEAMSSKKTKAANLRKLKDAHKNSIKAHQELYLRNTLSLAGSKTQETKTTDRRIADYAAGCTRDSNACQTGIAEDKEAGDDGKEAGADVKEAGDDSKEAGDDGKEAGDDGKEADAEDNALAALYYNYGRYLLICSTRAGLLPPNLQGLWSNSFLTPWNGDYHTNINVQMNHWIAESGNLHELHEPLIDLVMRLIPSGEKSAKDFYGQAAEGWVLHMMTNVWNYTAPGEHPSWGATNTGGAWLCAHLWEHYLYNGDLEYLQKVYPALKGASEFFLSTMITEPSHGWLVTAPTSSPENSFIVDGPEGKTAVSICMGPTMDNQLIRELFTNTAAAAELLYPKSETPAQPAPAEGQPKAQPSTSAAAETPAQPAPAEDPAKNPPAASTAAENQAQPGRKGAQPGEKGAATGREGQDPAASEQAFASRLREAITKLPPHQISEEGYLMEWLEDYKEAEPQHRHVSHLYGLYPGSQISPSQTPELAEACKVTLNRRGDEATGWSRAWKINFWARLGDGDRALKLFRSLLAPAAYEGCAAEYCNAAGTYPNMLCAHPPFQIDGNFGGAAGISEMLVQSNEGFINILPALPSEWSEGCIKGLKVRGGATIDLEWADGKATKVTITGGWKENIKLHMQNDLWIEFNLAKGHKKCIRFD